MLQIIEQKVTIESMYLDNNIKNHLLNKLKKTMEGKCTYDNGYIITVNKIITIGNNIIGGANSLAIFDITYEAKILKPKKGHVLTGKVFMVFPYGILIDICGKMNVLVPVEKMEGYKYQEESNSFTLLKHSIQNEVELSIEIIDTKYEKKQFSCIGKLYK